MGFLSLEHGKWAYFADFALYGMAVLALAIYLFIASPPLERLDVAVYALLGLAGWTGIEYALHRFVLHGLPVFRAWHQQHHRRPTSLICTPTILSATLIATLFFAPAVMLTSYWRAAALTLGMLSGYLAYTITHHAIHHWRSENAWLKRRKHWHALHHATSRSICYGVTSAFWDHVLDSTRQRTKR